MRREKGRSVHRNLECDVTAGPRHLTARLYWLHDHPFRIPGLLKARVAGGGGVGVLAEEGLEEVDFPVFHNRVFQLSCLLFGNISLYLISGLGVLVKNTFLHSLRLSQERALYFLPFAFPCKALV